MRRVLPYPFIDQDCKIDVVYEVAWTSARFLSFWEGLVIYSSYQVEKTTCLESFRFLCTYPGKDSSAWTEV